jgi:hypothetical protein
MLGDEKISPIGEFLLTFCFFWHNCVLEALQTLSHETSALFGEQPA